MNLPSLTKTLSLLLAILTSSCASVPQETNHAVCVLDVKSTQSKCASLTGEWAIQNELMDSYICMPPKDFETYSSECSINKKKLKKLLGK